MLQRSNRGRLGADEHVARILPLGDRADQKAGRRVDRHVLQRVNGAVDAAIQQRFLDLLGEEPFAADLEQPTVLHTIARCGDAHQRRGRFDILRRGAEQGRDPPLHHAGLHQRQLGGARADSDGLLRGRGQRTSSEALRWRDAAPATRDATH